MPCTHFLYPQTLSMFIARIVFFRLHESPRYLVHAGRPQEALESLQLISRFNGSEIDLDLEDVDDQRVMSTDDRTRDVGGDVEGSAISSQQNQDGEILSSLPATTLFDADAGTTGRITADYRSTG